MRATWTRRLASCDVRRLCVWAIPVPNETSHCPWALVILENCRYACKLLLQGVHLIFQSFVLLIISSECELDVCIILVSLLQ